MDFNPDAYLAQKEAPGGFDPDAYLASKEAPAPEGKSVSGLLSNAVSDAGGMASGLVQAASHPIDTVGNIATHLPEIGHGMLHSWGMDSQDSGHRMQTLADEAYKHPVSHLLDAASVAIPGLKAAGLMPEALEGANVAAKAGEVAGDASDALGRRALGYTKAGLKGDNLGKANEATRYAIDSGILKTGSTPEEMIAANKAMKAEVGGNIGDILKAEPGSFDSSEALHRLEALRPKDSTGEILRGGKYDALNKEIDEAAETIKAHGGGDIPWSTANELKKTVREGTNFNPMVDKGVNNVRKGIGGEVKDAIDSQLEDSMKARGADVKPFLDAKSDYGNIKNLEKPLDNRQAMLSGNRVIGLGDTILGGLGAVAHGPLGAIGTVLAKKAIEKFGMTGGAVLGRKIALMMEQPGMAAKYGKVIDGAINAGPAAVATTMHLIEQHEGGNQQ